MIKITWNDFLKLKGEELSVKEQKKLLAIINDRFDYIIRKIALRMEWYDYENGGTEYGLGSFEYSNYNMDSEISFVGDFLLPEPYCDEGIPVRWLWEDFEDEYVKEIERVRLEHLAAIEKEKLDKESKKSRDEELKKSISNKLTKEERKLIIFK